MAQKSTTTTKAMRVARETAKLAAARISVAVGKSNDPIEAHTSTEGNKSRATPIVGDYIRNLVTAVAGGGKLVTQYSRTG